MESDYIPIEELYKKQEPIKVKSKDDGLTPFMKFGKASFIIWKSIWFVVTKTLKGVYNGLLALNNAIDKARESEVGKAMMKKYEKENTGFSFGMPPQQNSKGSTFGIQKGGKSKKQQNPFGGW